MNESTSYDQVIASQMRALTKHLPLNSLGLPTGFWRPDLLPLQESVNDELNQVTNEYEEKIALTTDDQLDLFNPPDISFLQFSTAASERPHHQSSNLPALLGIEIPGIQTPLGLPQEILDSAFIPLSYEEGYPALPSGWPFWERLEFEPEVAHSQFKRYLELGKKEFRILPQLADTEAELAELNLFSSLYYWPVRARCYDLFYQASRKRQRESLIYDLELEHLQTAQKYRAAIEEYMDTSEFTDLLTPMVAVNLLKLCWQMERVSAGMPLNGPSSPFSSGGGARQGELPQGSSLELSIRQLIRREREAVPHEALTLDADGKVINAADDAANAFQDRLLSNPELVTLAQELVLKLTSGG